MHCHRCVRALLYCFVTAALLEALILSKSGFDVERWDLHRITELSLQVSEISKSILLRGETERSYTGKFSTGERYNLKEDGVYVCAIGGLPLFLSKHKFVSGTGWPSFYDVFDSAHIVEIPSSGSILSTEILCARTGCHVGHKFPDTPPPVMRRKFNAEGITKYRQNFSRYCVNAGALRFVPMSELDLLT